MNRTHILKQTITMMILVLIIACSASRKATSTASPATPASATSNSSPAPASENTYLFSGNYSSSSQLPGMNELTAIQTRYANATLDQLKEGHAIYNGKACLRCHEVKNIYSIKDLQWKSIMEDMALKAALSDTQKEAVYRYVLAMKATQSK